MSDQEIIIKLLGRIAFTPEEIRNMVIFKKGDKSKSYINGFNACDGSHKLTEIAEIIGVTSGTLSPILKQWEEIGIVYKTGDCYKKIMSI